jgi:Ser/Thr protein kinase RdoA (MazF antagonist)
MINTLNRFLPPPPAAPAPSFTRLEGGHIHQTWLAERGGEQLILQRLNPFVFAEPELLSRNNLVIADWLEAKGYPRYILRPLAAPSGETIAWVDGAPWRAFPYVAHTRAGAQAQGAQEVRKAAAAIGEWHTFLKDLDPGLVRPAIPGFFDLAHRWGQWEAASQEALPERARRAQREIAWLDSGAFLVDRFRETELPLRILHGDPKLSNILFDAVSGELKAIIDWDTAQPGWIVFDFGDMARAYMSAGAEDEPDLNRVRIHQPFAEALLEGFLGETESWLTPAERGHLFLGAQWVIWMQALRFLADYLTGDHYYPVRYEDHNLVRARNHLKLWENLGESAIFDAL